LLIICETKKLPKTISLSLFFYCIILLCSPFLLSAQQKEDTRTLLNYAGLEKQIDSIIYEAIIHKAFPGCVVYAACEDSVLFHKPYGYHRYDSLIKTSEDDIYDLASITKIAGATIALMKLYDDGLLFLDDPINKYVQNMGGRVGKVTVRRALAHQGGLYPWIPFHEVIRKRNRTFKKKDIAKNKDENHEFQLAKELFLSNDFYEKQIKKRIRKSEVVTSPSHKYSGLFFYLVPEIVLNLTGVPYEEYLEKNVYNPLKAETLVFNPLEDFPSTRIPPTEIDSFFRMEPIHGKVHDEGAIMMRGISGNAGLFGNADDLSKLMAMLLQDGTQDTTNLLSQQTIDLFTTIQYPNQGNRRGLGFDKPLIEYDSIVSSVARDASHLSFGHTGYTGTLAWADPKNGLIFIFLTNRVYPTRSNRALYQMNVRPTIHQLFYDYINTDFTSN